MDFRNNMQKVYVTEEEKEKFMEKLNKDVEVSPVVSLLCHTAAASARRGRLRCCSGSRITNVIKALLSMLSSS